jgi:hypothetical protein
MFSPFEPARGSVVKGRQFFSKTQRGGDFLMIARLSLSAGLLLALTAAGCASSGLATQPPAGVNLSGEWVLNTSLSDDTTALGELAKAAAKRHHRKGSADDATADDATASSTNVPARMSIRQEGAKLLIQADTPREYTMGAHAPCGSELRCTAGWRGAVFILDVKPHEGKSREETYALDSEGHLIVEIQTGKVDVKLAYDRARS